MIRGAIADMFPTLVQDRERKGDSERWQREVDLKNMPVEKAFVDELLFGLPAMDAVTLAISANLGETRTVVRRQRGLSSNVFMTERERHTNTKVPFLQHVGGRPGQH
jgi:hypothetical protein